MNWIAVGQTIFAASVALILYVYAGYPMLVFLVARLFGKPVQRAPFEPNVSFIITAFNEELDIGKKLENTFELDYPAEKIEVIVASDASTDATDAIVKEFSVRGVKLVRQAERRGKTAAQNLAVEHSAGEIIVFSDATSDYEPNAIREMVRNFTDPTVGCVAGRLNYVDEAKTSVGSAARSYWSYEVSLKRAESWAGSLIGVSGCIYAVRRANYVPMYDEACSDFLIATLIHRQGLRTVFEPDAVCTEETNRDSRKEMRMRVRVISQTISDLWRNREILDPFRSGFFAIQMASHKVLRYCVPVFGLAAFVSSGLLAIGSRPFLLIFGVQLLFMMAAAIGWALERLGTRGGPFGIPYYFLLANIASVAGFLQFLRGERYAAWEPIRESRQALRP